MTPEELRNLRDRIVEAVQLSGKMIVEQKRLLNQPLVISVNGVVKHVNPNDIKID